MSHYELIVASPPPESLARSKLIKRGARHARLWIGVVQHAWQPDAAALISDIETAAARAVDAGAQLVCLPELTLSPYFCSAPPNDDEPSPFEPWLSPEDFKTGPTLALATRIALRHSVFVQASLFERSSDVIAYEGIERGFNTSICVGPDGSLVSKTRKVHIPVTQGYEEDLFFDPSDAANAGGPTPLIGAARVGFPTCWDQWFPELSRSYALDGADVLVYPTAIGSEPEHPAFDTQPAWQAVMVGQAIASGLFIVAANRVGREDLGGAVASPVTFYGSSFVCDPYGRVLVQAPRDRPAVLVAELDLSARRDWLSLFPLLATRRPETYAALCRSHVPPSQPGPWLLADESEEGGRSGHETVAALFTPRAVGGGGLTSRGGTTSRGGGALYSQIQSSTVPIFAATPTNIALAAAIADKVASASGSALTAAAEAHSAALAAAASAAAAAASAAAAIESNAASAVVPAPRAPPYDPKAVVHLATPAADGYYMPAEWAPHAQTWIIW